MDLYEALKAGTSAQELLDAFYKDLDAANERITAEKAEEEAKAAAAKQKEEEERQHQLSIARADAADFLADYLNILFQKDEDVYFNPEEIEDVLLELEELSNNMMMNWFSFFKKEPESKKEKDQKSAAAKPKEKKENPSIKIKYSTDDDIIKDFLKLFK